MKKIAYVIGRFQPFHNGHRTMINKALEIANNVVVVIGDTGCRPDYKNPWTVKERIDMIRSNFSASTNERLFFASVEDVPYDDNAWADAVHNAVGKVGVSGLPWEKFLVGHKKDGSSFYLDLFPEWKLVEVEPYGQEGARIDATAIRNAYFAPSGFLMGLPSGSYDWLLDWKTWNWTRWHQISAEREAVLKHNAEWDCEAVRKYGGPVIAAVDALLHTDEEVLLIRRGKGVGKGALALPGGFVDPSERLLDAALRELHEETGIRLDKRNFDSKPGALIPFDHPDRSMRGRIITNVLKAKVPGAVANFPPTAGDDASEALWVKKADLPGMKREFFADHYHIINTLLN